MNAPATKADLDATERRILAAIANHLTIALDAIRGQVPSHIQSIAAALDIEHGHATKETKRTRKSPPVAPES